ncbi:MAG: aldolase catalytic domain-containing protein [Selenomonadaceae bacterium]|nr:aldolase catalytic domain-containing protein [Selenomonadaceae bacterium]
MRERYLLDCTLRDGGYVNNWEFGHEQMMEIFQRLVSSGVEFIEIGFLDEREQFDWNRSIQPDTECYNKLYAGRDKGEATVLAMIDYGKCGIEHLQPASETFIDAIRVIFKEHVAPEALAFCQQVQDLGYKVFAQMVSVTTYTDEALREFVARVNELHPFATSMVDTYGLLDEEHLMHIFGILDQHLAPDIKEGFHAHNNFQLGFANAKHFLASSTERDILADGTLYGMGKSAGNAPLELLMLFMNEKMGKHYVTNQALEAIDNVIMDVYRHRYWGYNLFFYIASATQCHPNYVSYFMNKHTLSVKRITELLGTLQPAKRLLYDKDYAEQMYQQYQSVSCDDSQARQELAAKWRERELLLVGPGQNIQRQEQRVQRFIAAKRPYVIAVNYIPQNIRVDAIFLTKSKRYTQMMDALQSSINAGVEVIATSNVTRTAQDFAYVLRYSDLIDTETEIVDNSLAMLLRLLLACQVHSVNLAGFDGYSRTDDNYFDQSFEYSFSKEKADYLNAYMCDFLKEHEQELYVSFLTDSVYSL